MYQKVKLQLLHKSQLSVYHAIDDLFIIMYPPITYSWTVPLILDHSYLVGNLTSPKIAETKTSELLESWHFCVNNIWTC
jgi:hypothetical protein